MGGVGGVVNKIKQHILWGTGEKKNARKSSRDPEKHRTIFTLTIIL